MRVNSALKSFFNNRLVVGSGIAVMIVAAELTVAIFNGVVPIN